MIVIEHEAKPHKSLLDKISGENTKDSLAVPSTVALLSILLGIASIGNPVLTELIVISGATAFVAAGANSFRMFLKGRDQSSHE